MKGKSAVRSVQLAFLVFSNSLTGAILTGNRIASANSPQQQSGRPQASTQPAEKTIEQTQKNIQILKGLPESQLTPVMNLMASSLGVKCTYCHVNKGGEWIFESDEKPEKRTAREMIKMVLDINKTSFRGDVEVSCYTCHHGRTRPASVVQLPVPEIAPPVPRAAPGANAEGALPTSDQILHKYLQAIGGEAAVDKMRARVTKGSFNGGGASWPYELYQLAPDKFYSSLTTPQGVRERGFDGATGWEKSPLGVREIEGQELEELKRMGVLFENIKLKEQFMRIGGVGKDKIDGRDVYVIRATAKDGRRERLFFDAETGLLRRRISARQTIIGIVPEEIGFDDYREVDGIKLPFTIRFATVDPLASGTEKVTETKLNGELDKGRFVRPPK